MDIHSVIEFRLKSAHFTQSPVYEDFLTEIEVGSTSYKSGLIKLEKNNCLSFRKLSTMSFSHFNIHQKIIINLIPLIPQTTRKNNSWIPREGIKTFISIDSLLKLEKQKRKCFQYPLFWNSHFRGEVKVEVKLKGKTLSWQKQEQSTQRSIILTHQTKTFISPIISKEKILITPECFRNCKTMLNYDKIEEKDRDMGLAEKFAIIDRKLSGQKHQFPVWQELEQQDSFNESDSNSMKTEQQKMGGFDFKKYGVIVQESQSELDDDKQKYY